MESYIFLQHYWWFIISLLGGVLVFMMFVQGGQTLIYKIGKTKEEQNLIVNSLGHKWDITFTTLVTFGGAFFASFPLFYSTSFSGAFYVWMTILLFFVIQAIAYEYRSKAGNIFGTKTYDWFLILNGLFGTILIGTAVGTFFTGGEFIVSRDNIANLTGSMAISQWQTAWRGLEAVTDIRNVLLGLSVFFLSRMVAIHYFYNNIDDKQIVENAKKPLLTNTLLFVVCFVTFVSLIFTSQGWEVNPLTSKISLVEYKYFINAIQMPIVTGFFLLSVLSVLWGAYIAIKKQSKKAVWFSGIGSVIAVTTLLLFAGYNNTAYYPSLSDMQSSLTIYNSSSSEFTLKTMAVVSLFIPIVIAYIWYVWRNMNKKPMSKEALESDHEAY